MHMKYWSWMAAKLVAIAGLVGMGWLLIQSQAPAPVQFRHVRLNPFGTDLGYTTAFLGLWLAAVGLVYLAIRDQRLRCRTCARRLRMPVSSGRWNHILMGRPQTDYICAWGHGTLRVPDWGIAGPEGGSWEPIDDMWRELEQLQGSGR
jgi:hypothetical protein